MSGRSWGQPATQSKTSQTLFFLLLFYVFCFSKGFWSFPWTYWFYLIKIGFSRSGALESSLGPPGGLLGASGSSQELLGPPGGIWELEHACAICFAMCLMNPALIE